MSGAGIQASRDQGVLTHCPLTGDSSPRGCPSPACGALPSHGLNPLVSDPKDLPPPSMTQASGVGSQGPRWPGKG